MERWIAACRNSWNGLGFAFGSERAVREEIIALVLAVPAAFFIGVTPWRRLELIAVVLVLLIVELLNTGLEKLSDRVTRDRDPQIARVKDMSSAAVGLTLLLAIAVWLLALVERLGLV